MLTMASICSAQSIKYVKATRGQAVPFDTAVIVEIGQYRVETKKLRAADALIRGYDSEILGVYRELALSDSLRSADAALIDSKDRQLAIKDQTISQLNQQFNALLQLKQPRPNWFARNKFWIGIITGGAVSAYICLK